jgi:hypothetical protein
MVRRESGVQVEGLDLFIERWEGLVRSGTMSLERAYEFGAVAKALHDLSRRTYSWESLGRLIDRKGPTVAIYAKLFEAYPHVKGLQAAAEALGTWDISKLAGVSKAAAWHYTYKCMNCGSDDIAKVKGDRKA